jgi:hypothetical protein
MYSAPEAPRAPLRDSRASDRDSESVQQLTAPQSWVTRTLADRVRGATTTTLQRRFIQLNLKWRRKLIAPSTLAKAAGAPSLPSRPNPARARLRSGQVRSGILLGRSLRP